MPLYPDLSKVNPESSNTHKSESIKTEKMALSLDIAKYMLIKFDDAFAERRTSSRWQLELNSCRQNFNEPVLEYANKIENCYLKLINTLSSSLCDVKREACVDLLKDQALNVFIAGLNKDLTILVKSQKPETLESAIAIALSEEQEIKSKQEINRYQNINNSYRKHCTVCNKAGHTTLNCRYNQKYNNRGPSSSNVRHFQNNSNFNRNQNSHYKNTFTNTNTRNNPQYSNTNNKF
ncbi:hypothetical protein NQ317_018810, partial [Molorchus minor]